jgi:hypothetical protein
MPLLEGRANEPRHPIAFQSPERVGPGDQMNLDRRHLALIGDRYHNPDYIRVSLDTSVGVKRRSDQSSMSIVRRAR